MGSPTPEFAAPFDYGNGDPWTPPEPLRPQPPVEPPAPTPYTPEPPRPAKRRRGLVRRLWRRRIIKYPVILFIVANLFVFFSAVAFNFVSPATTMFMLMDEADGPTIQQDVSLEHVSRFYVATVMLHEDGTFPTRVGAYDINHFIERAYIFITTGDDIGGTGIPQQLVKNIYLPRGDMHVVSVPRKLAEAIFAWPFNFAITDWRQLELYLNYAQFGPNLYGICAASWYYFNRPPWDGDLGDAIDLAGILPLGEDVKRAEGGGIDIVSPGTWLVNSYVQESRKKLPLRLDEAGGWMGALEPLGLTDTAGDYADRRGDADACATMPKSVADRLGREGAWWSKEYGG